MLIGDQLYRLQGVDLIACWNWSTGAEVFKKERLDGVNTAASPIATADGLIYCVSGGKSYVLKAGPTLEVLARNDLADPCQASPAVAARAASLSRGGDSCIALARGSEVGLDLERFSIAWHLARRASEEAHVPPSPERFGLRSVQCNWKPL